MSIELDCTITQDEANRVLQCTHQDIVFHGHIIKKLDFSNIDVSGVYFAGIWMEDTSFKNSTCLSTSFYGAFLENIDFSGADLSDTIFRKSKMSGCNLKGIKAPLWKNFICGLKTHNHTLENDAQFARLN